MLPMVAPRAPRPRSLRCCVARLVRCCIGGLAVLLASGAVYAVEYRAASGAATVLYDGPSQKARPIIVVGRDYPLEVLVSVEGWLKVRDATGALAWVEKKSVTERRTVIVRVPVADVYSGPDASAPVAFRAGQDLLLLIDDSGGAPPGWVAVRHRDGQSGFVRVQQVWGY
jgi:hypothetical protein